jgi:hypothetical protein
MNLSSFAKALCLFSLLIVGMAQTAWAQRRYNRPQYRGYGLDWCYVFTNQCGQPAADAFCHLNGQGPATNWAKWSSPGFSTMTIGQNSVCDPASHVCDSFSFIECQNISRTFAYPTYRGYRLDWCRVFANGCGAPAADAFCRAHGYSGNSAFRFQSNPGVPTMTIGQNSVCQPSVHVCDSFTSITCR